MTYITFKRYCLDLKWVKALLFTHSIIIFNNNFFSRRISHLAHWTFKCRFPPGDGKTDFVSDRQDSLQVLGAEGAGLPEGDAGGKALDDDRVRVVLDPLVRHLDGVLNAQCLPILPVEQILDLLSQRVGQVDPGQLGLQTLCRQKRHFEMSSFLLACCSYSAFSLITFKTDARSWFMFKQQ